MPQGGGRRLAFLWPQAPHWLVAMSTPFAAALWERKRKRQGTKSHSLCRVKFWKRSHYATNRNEDIYEKVYHDSEKNRLLGFHSFKRSQPPLHPIYEVLPFGMMSTCVYVCDPHYRLNGWTDFHSYLVFGSSVHRRSIEKSNNRNRNRKYAPSPKMGPKTRDWDLLEGSYRNSDYLLTELSPSWEAANCAAIHKIPSNFKEFWLHLSNLRKQYPYRKLNKWHLQENKVTRSRDPKLLIYVLSKPDLPARRISQYLVTNKGLTSNNRFRFQGNVVKDYASGTLLPTSEVTNGIQIATGVRVSIYPWHH
jgi:hypothetical protein